jgi:hypothetical protein
VRSKAEICCGKNENLATLCEIQSRDSLWIFFNAPEDRRKNEFGRLQALYRRGRVSFNFLSAPWAGFGGKGKGREREVKF